MVKAEIVLELCEERHLASFKPHDTKTIQSLQGPFKTGFHAWLQHAWGPGTGWATMQYAANWLPKGILPWLPTGIPPLLKHAECFRHAVPLEQLLQAKQPPILTMVVMLSKVVTKIDKTRLAEQIKAIIKRMLQSLPSPRVKDPQKARQALTWTSSWNPSAIRTDQPPRLTLTLDCSQVNQHYLKALTDLAMDAVEGTLADMPQELREQWQEPAWMKDTLQWEKFAEALRRYKWWIQEKDYRSIARREYCASIKATEEGKDVDTVMELFAPDRSLRIPQSVEVSRFWEYRITRGVQKIQRILDRSLAPGADQGSAAAQLEFLRYDCPYDPSHNCAPTCPYLKAWQQEVERILSEEGSPGE
jgi:hypothetical protein